MYAVSAPGQKIRSNMTLMTLTTGIIMDFNHSEMSTPMTNLTLNVLNSLKKRRKRRKCPRSQKVMAIATKDKPSNPKN